MKLNSILIATWVYPSWLALADAIWWEMWGRMGIHFVLNY